MADKLVRRAFSCRREGLTIRGTIYRLPGEEPRPAAIVCHGFMATQGTVRQYARALANMGWTACCFDFCGGSVAFGKSDGATCDMSVKTEVRDLLAVITALQARPDVSAGKLLLAGHSQGGLVAALTAAQLGTKVTHLAMLAPALCIPDDARAGQMMFARFDPADIPERIHCGPMLLGRCYPADVLDMDPLAEIAVYPGDVLIFHGTEDGIVKPVYAQRALAAYEQRPCGSVALHMMDGAGHTFSRREDREIIAQLAAFARPEA